MANVRIGDVARAAGVSLGTVSNALNHPEKVRPETLELINQTIARLGFVPNQGARQLAGGRSKMLGLVLPRLDHAFSLQIANGAQDEAREHGYDLLIASAGNDDILENHYMRYFLGAQVAGVLVQPMAGRSWKPPLESTPIPTVYLDVHSKEPGNYIAPDNEAQGRLMLEHAISCGAKRVCVAGEASFMQLMLRVRGICDAAREAGVEVELVGRGEWNTVADGFELGRELAARDKEDRPDFVVGLTDVLAAGIIEGLINGGVSVPEDILVAGCDGNPLAWSGSVPLTTIASPGEEIGRRGVRLLLRIIAGEEQQDTNQEMLAPMLLVRASTATTKADKANAEQPELDLAEYL